MDQQTEAQLRSFFRNVPTEGPPGKPGDRERGVGQTIEITVERETVSVFYPGVSGSPGAETRCPCCGQVVLAQTEGCAIHAADSGPAAANNNTISGSAVKKSEPPQTISSDEVQQ